MNKRPRSQRLETERTIAAQKAALPPARFIPFRRSSILEMICQDERLEEGQSRLARDLCKLIEAYYHFRFHQKLEVLKEAYFPFNPDIDVQSVQIYSPDRLKACAENLTAMLTEVLNDANYERIPHDQLLEALVNTNLFSLKLDIDFNDFEEFLVYGRGSVVKTEEQKRYFFFKREVVATVYDRIVLFIRFKDWDHFHARERKKNLNFDPGSTLIKMFKDIPRDDLEMLFPNTVLRMRTSDKLLLGIPAIGGAVPILVTKIAPFLPILISVVLAWFAGKNIKEEKVLQALVQGGIALGVLAGYCWRQWEKFKNRRIKYLKSLTDNLYFRNLDNNAGVFHRLIDAAEEEEVKEAFLAYYFLLMDGPLNEKELDDAVERWFAEKHSTTIDFEVNGALTKLKDMGIGFENDGRWTVMPIPDALNHIDSIWDGLFQFNSEPDPTVAPA